MRRRRRRRRRKRKRRNVIIREFESVGVLRGDAKCLCPQAKGENQRFKQKDYNQLNNRLRPLILSLTFSPLFVSQSRVLVRDQVLLFILLIYRAFRKA